MLSWLLLEKIGREHKIARVLLERESEDRTDKNSTVDEKENSRQMNSKTVKENTVVHYGEHRKGKE